MLFLAAEYDVSDERAVQITHKAVSNAFVFILVYSFFIVGSYMFIPNYFVDYIWYPLFYNGLHSYRRIADLFDFI